MARRQRCRPPALPPRREQARLGARACSDGGAPRATSRKKLASTSEQRALWKASRAASRAIVARNKASQESTLGRTPGSSSGGLDPTGADTAPAPYAHSVPDSAQSTIPRQRLPVKISTPTARRKCEPSVQNARGSGHCPYSVCAVISILSLCFNMFPYFQCSTISLQGLCDRGSGPVQS